MNANNEGKRLLYITVANAMEHDILVERKFGERLPSEQNLAQRYNVSRTVIREALKLLSERGLIDSKVGSGAFITKPETHNLSNFFYRIISMNDIESTSVYDVRCILEVAAAKKAARLVTEEELDKMDAILNRLRDLSLPQSERNELDYLFHSSVARASGNPLLAMLIDAMRSVITEMIERSSRPAGSIPDGVMRHDNIMSALRQHDVELAELYMMDHILMSKNFYMTEYQDPPKLVDVI